MIAPFHAITDYHTLPNGASTDVEKPPVTIGVYASDRGVPLVGPRGLEPLTSCVSSKRSTWLS